MFFPQKLKYTKDHEWIEISGSVLRVGITDFAQRELGDIVFVEVNTQGSYTNREDVFGTIEAVKTVSDLFAPIGGLVNKINPLLESNPELINSDPYGEGWICEIEIDNELGRDQYLEDFKYLLSDEEYKELIGES